MTSPPYECICFLTIENSSGGVFMEVDSISILLTQILLPLSQPATEPMMQNTVGLPRSQLASPERHRFMFSGYNLYAAPQYVTSGNPDYDYGLKLLPRTGTPDKGFGWSVIVDDEELNDRIVTNCGYPGNKPPGTMGITGGKISSYTANRISYMNDTMGGQRGSPVYTWYGGYWTVIGVYSYGGCPNSDTQITTEMICRLLKFMNLLEIKSLRSLAFPNVYLRCNGAGVTSHTGPGGQQQRVQSDRRW